MHSFSPLNKFAVLDHKSTVLDLKRETLQLVFGASTPEQQRLLVLSPNS